MKQFILCGLFINCASLQKAQTQYATGALMLSKENYEGTARSIAMGNAFTALGGDIGAITINPAASGIYRYSEFSITPAISGSVSHSNYLENNSSANNIGFGIPGGGWVGYFSTGRKKGLLNMNISIITNKTNDYVGKSSAFGTESLTSWLTSQAVNMPSGIKGSDLTMPDDNPDYPFYNTNAPWKSILAWNTSLLENLQGSPEDFVAAVENIYQDENNSNIHYYKIGGPLDQKFSQVTTGYTQDFTLKLGGNVYNKFFFGVNFTVQSIWYRHAEYYSETAQDKSNFDTSFEYFKHSLHQTMDGVGYNIRAGIIYLPVAGLRIGASISTPTWITINDYSYEAIESQVYNKSFSATSPENSYQYRMNSPFRWNLGAAYTFGKKALVSVDYEGVSYSSAKFIIFDGMSHTDQNYFTNENSLIRSSFRTVTNIRAGLEYKVIPEFSLRAGYNYYDNTEKNFKDSRHYATAGVGYSGKSGFFIDAAYMQQCNYNKNSYTLYDYDTEYGIPIVSEKSLGWKVLLTLGVRF